MPLSSWISLSRENLIVTKVSLRKINNYQDLNRSVGKITNFRQFYCDDYIKFGFHWTGDEQMAIAPLCVVCGQKLSIEAMVPSMLKRHCIANHSNLQTKTIVYFQRLLQANSRQSKYFRKQ